MKPVVIFGIGDFARIAAVYLREDSDHEVAAFTVDEQFIAEDELLGLPVVPFEGLLTTHPPDAYALFVAIGFSRVNKARTEVYHRCKDLGYELISYVSSSAHVPRACAAMTWSCIGVAISCTTGRTSAANSSMLLRAR